MADLLSGTTPAPWRFDHDWQRLPTIFGADGTKVCYIEKGGLMPDSRTMRQEFDAKLIEAAPSLAAENARYRQALERIAADELTGFSAARLATSALKDGPDIAGRV